MNPSAKITMLISQGLIVAITLFFFIKVLTMPKKPEPDSYADNDEDEF